MAWWIKFRVQNNAKMSFWPYVRKMMVKTWISRSNVLDMTIVCAWFVSGGYTARWIECMRMMLTSSLNLGCAESGSEWFLKNLKSIWPLFERSNVKNINVKVKRIRHGNTLFRVRFQGVLWCAKSNSECKIIPKCHFDLIWRSWRSKHENQGLTY